MKRAKFGPPLRRALALGAGAAVLCGLYTGTKNLSLPRLWSEDALDTLAGALVAQETAGFEAEGDEQSIWDALVSSELPADGADEPADTAPAALPAPLPAADSTAPEDDAEAPAASEPEDNAPEQSEEAAADPEDGGTAVARTIGANSETISGGGVSINNSTKGISVDPAALAGSTLTQTIVPASEGPQILIMHTHATEAYTMAGDDRYEETDSCRTSDANYNMLRIGEEMKAEFEAQGFSVLHDTTLYDYPSYTGSYTRSLAGIKQILTDHPSISVVLDVHRDALIAEDGTVYKAVTEVNGQPTAQVMLVAGTNDGGLEHPNWLDNLDLAAHIQLQMAALEPTLPRPINLRAQRFNQHLTPCSLLVEVGTSGNTLQEAIRGARYFAQSAGAVYRTLVQET